MSENLTTCLEHTAIDSAGVQWGDLASRHGDHRFIEQGNALRDFSLPDQGAALPLQVKRLQIFVTETYTDRGSPYKS